MAVICENVKAFALDGEDWQTDSDNLTNRRNASRGTFKAEWNLTKGKGSKLSFTQFKNEKVLSALAKGPQMAQDSTQKDADKEQTIHFAFDSLRKSAQSADKISPENFPMFSYRDSR